MVLYRRNRVAGGTYFFTVTLLDRRSDVLVRHIDELRESFRLTKNKKPFKIEGVVILPDHIHAIFTLPENDDDYPGRWKSIKSMFTRRLVKRGLSLKRNEKGEYDLWQRRYWEHTIRDEEDMQRHLDYIHFNPVKHGLVEQVIEWPYSSFHRYVNLEILESEWAGGVDEEEKEFGE